MKKIPRPKKQTQVLLGFLFLFISCDGAYQRYIISGKTMGTTYSVKLVFIHSDHEKSKIEKVIDSILISLNQQMSTWIDDSEISIFNKSLSTAPYKVSDEFFHVLERGKKINKKYLFISKLNNDPTNKKPHVCGAFCLQINQLPLII